MISDETISQLATKYQTSIENIQREYFQHLFLSYFYQQSKSENILFKGGTALRIVHNSPRFSEDLDFDSVDIDYQGIESLVLETLSQMEKENIHFNLKEGKKTTGGFLANIFFDGFTRAIAIRLEISQRKGEKKGEVSAILNDFIPIYNVVSVAQEQLVAGKMSALLDRKKPRDFYDLYFILRKELPLPQKKTVVPQTLKALKESKINFEAELKQFLPKSQWLIIRDFKATLERELKRA
jgi:predicted nucleotidyltransferase component of viral defense system